MTGRFQILGFKTYLCKSHYKLAFGFVRATTYASFDKSTFSLIIIAILLLIVFIITLTFDVWPWKTVALP